MTRRESPKAPRTAEQWQPPADPVRGRAAFYVVGLLIGACGVGVIAFASELGLDVDLARQLGVVPPCFAVGLVLVQRVRAGERWRVGALVAGLVTPFVAMVLLKALSLILR